MRKFYSDNKMLIDTLVSNGITFTCNDDKEMLVSDEDAERIENMVPALCPAAKGDYHIGFLHGLYYVVQYDHPVLYFRLLSLPPHPFRNRVVCNSYEEAKAIFNKELSATKYKKVEDLGYELSDSEFDKNAFNLCIDKLTVDEDGDEEYETIEMSNETFYNDEV